MTFGIREPHNTKHVPGTVLLDQSAAHSEGVTDHLKHAKGKDSNLILSPQPSEDPNDPLNWSSFKKHTVLYIVCFGVIVHGTVPGPLLNAGILNVALDLHKSPSDVAVLGGYVLLAGGAAGLFISALGRKYGKRPFFVLSSILSLIGCIVSETAGGYNTLVAGRVLQGLSVAAYESLSIALIGDVFFVHERGSRVAIILFILAAISNGISIIAGVITADLGWRYNFHVLLPFVALQTILVIFFVPETCYRRKAIYETDTVGSDENLDRLARYEERQRHAGDAEKVEHTQAELTEIDKTMTRQITVETIPPKKTFLQNMSLYNGTFVDDSVFKMVLACMTMFLNVGALYQVLSTGLIIAWYVGVAVGSGVVLALPPFALSPATIGYMSAGPLIGGFLASALMYFLSEPAIKAIVRRNKGIYEPEFHLVNIAPSAILTVAGLMGWAYSIQNVENIYTICFCWGLMLFGQTALSTSCTSWALDAFRQYSTEIFVLNMVFKNFFYYGLTNYIVDWFLLQGPVKMAGVMAGITAFLAILALPMYMYGKVYRNYWHHHNLVKIFRLETDKTGAE